MLGKGGCEGVLATGRVRMWHMQPPQCTTLTCVLCSWRNAGTVAAAPGPACPGSAATMAAVSNCVLGSGPNK